MASVDVIKTISPSGEEDDVLSINNTDAEEVSYTFGNILNFSGEYTFSCWMKSTSTNFDISVHISNVNHNFTITNEWQRIIYTGQANVAESREVLFTVPSGFNLYAYQGQLEKGTIATDFAVNPQDLLSSIYDVDNKIVTLQTNFEVQQGQIDALIRDTTIDGTKLKDKFTQMQATVDGLNVTVGDVQSDIGTINSQMASLNLTVDGLTTEVSQAGTDAEEAKTLAQQTSDKFSWLVKSGTSSTNFELTDRTATLVSEQINMKGLVSFSGLNKEVQDKINSADAAADLENLIPTFMFPTGANIAPWVTGTALSHTLGQSDPYGGTNALKLTPTAANPQMKINKGGVLKQTGMHTFSVWLKSDKEGQISVFVNTSQATSDTKKRVFDVGTTWKHYTMTVDVDDLNLDFDVLIGGFSTWSDQAFTLYVYKPRLVYGTDNTVIESWIQDAVVNNNTTIYGGYIKTGTISTDQLAVGDIFATGSAVMNIINAQEINADRITSGLIRSNFLELYGLNVLQKDTDVVTLSIDSMGNVTMRGTIESYNYRTGQEGWSIRSDGDAEFNNITMRGNLLGVDSGVIGSSQTASSRQVRFWAGASYENRNSAPFRVYSDGSVEATEGTYSGVWTGDIRVGNISIVDPSSTSGGDAVLTIQSGQTGVKAVELTDSGYSIFRQNVIVASNTGSTQISFNQDGSAYFDSNISIGGNATLDNDSLNIGGHELGVGSNGYVFRSNQVDIGSASLASNLNVYGSSEMHGSLKVIGDFYFGDVIKCTVFSNGINFDYVV